MSITQQQIAKKLKISPTTVSRSLRDDPTIAEQTRELVRRSAVECGYRLPQRKRHSFSPSSTRESAIAVLLNTEGINPVHSSPALQCLAGLSETAQSREVSLYVHMINGQQAAELADVSRQPIEMRQQQVEGLILLRSFDREIVTALNRQIPCVLIGHGDTRFLCDVVDADTPMVLQELVQHLYDLGHRRFGFVGQSHSYRHYRYAGFAQAMACHGIAPEKAVTLNVFQRSPSPRELVRQMLEHRDKGVTAWIASSNGDQLMRELIREGVRLPDDMSFAAVDATATDADYPRITTVCLPMKEIGKAALSQLKFRIAHRDEKPRHLFVRGDFMAGETTGPPPVNPHL